MPLIIDRKVFAQRSVPSNTDKVVSWAAIPAGGAFTGGTVRGSILGAEDRSVITAMVYGMSAYVLPMLDLNTLADPDAMWDEQVPKDDDVSEAALDFEVDIADTTPDVDIGPPQLDMLVGAKTGPKKLFRFERVVTFADSPTGHLAGTPDSYAPTARLGFRIKQAIRAEVPSVMLMAVSSPILSIPSVFTGTISEWAPTGAESWMQLQYLGDALERTAPFLTGVVEPGSESPYQEAAELVARMVEQAYEDTSGAFSAQTLQAFVASKMTIEVPGYMRVGRVSGG